MSIRSRLTRLIFIVDPRMRRMIPVLALAVLATMALTAPAAHALLPPDHLGDYGVHSPPGSLEFPAVRCRYASSGLLRSFRVRPPVAYAVNTTSALDAQTIRWRFRVEGSNDSDQWTVIHTSGVFTDEATDRLPAEWLPRTYDIPSLAWDYYKVVYRIVWQVGGTPDGSAEHEPWQYRLAKGTQAKTTPSCPADFAAPTASAASLPAGVSGLGAHSGKRGVHFPVDFDEYGGAICDLDGSGNLDRIVVRAPMVFARDRTSGVDGGKVAWRARVRWSDGPGDFQDDWQPLTATGWTTLGATDVRAARFTRKVIAIDVWEHAYFQVYFDLRWFRPGDPSEIVGRATHYVVHYDVEGSSQRLASCPVAVP